MGETESIVVVEGLCRQFGRRAALRDISFQVNRGEILAVLGPNGSGKTTLLRILAGTCYPTAGQVKVLGMSIEDQPLKIKRHLGYLAETTPLYGDMTVLEFLRFRGRLRGLRGQRLALRLRSVLEECALDEHARRLIRSLPRGTRQQVGIADCLIHSPDLLLLDEPFNGVDPLQARILRKQLRTWAEKSNAAILFSSHFLNEAAELAHRALILDAGRVAGWDTPAALAASAGHSFEAAFARLTTGRSVS